MSIRLAKESDLDAIVWISVAALPADPVCPYRFPYMDLYPEDHVKFSRIRYAEYMAAGDNVIMVFESPTIEDPAVHKPVAFSIWQLPETHVVKASVNEAAEIKPDWAVGGVCIAKQKGPPDHLQRRDASAARMMAFREAIGRAKGEMFDGPYGEGQLYLDISHSGNDASLAYSIVRTRWPKIIEAAVADVDATMSNQTEDSEVFRDGKDVVEDLKHTLINLQSNARLAPIPDDCAADFEDFNAELDQLGRLPGTVLHAV
ncbi:hypothetical protein MMC18_005816 [Xylographa bjoerkii]|nr:hypothetical protein [Xylographa bjoerkii]